MTTIIKFSLNAAIIGIFAIFGATTAVTWGFDGVWPLMSGVFFAGLAPTL